MSPEVILCRGHSTKADIYSLGATLIHMQTGTPPWVKRYPRSAYPSYLYIVSESQLGFVKCVPPPHTKEMGDGRIVTQERWLPIPTPYALLDSLA